MASVVGRTLALDDDLAYELQMQELYGRHYRESGSSSYRESGSISYRESGSSSGNQRECQRVSLADYVFDDESDDEVLDDEARGDAEGGPEVAIASYSEDDDDENNDAMSLRDDEGMLCEICQETQPLGSMVPLSCTHTFCIACLGQHGKVSVEAKKLPIPCPAPGCTCVISTEESSMFLEEDQYLQALHCLAELSIGNEERFYCPYKDCSVLMVKEAQAAGRDSRATCRGCNRDVCMECDIPWHEGATCEEYRAAPEGERDPEDFKLKQLATNSAWQRCYNCRAIVERSSGCPHMTCRCKAEFCYKCAKPWIKKRPTCMCFV